MKSIKAPKAKQLPSGAWNCRVMIGGQTISITRKSRREAEQEALRAKVDVTREIAAPMTLEKAYSEYITMRQSVLSASTIAGYIRLSHNTFQNLMRKPIGSITNRDIQAEINTMVGNGKSPKYISNANSLLSSVFKQFRPNFGRTTRLPRKQKTELRQVEIDEIISILSIIEGKEIELPVLLAIWMGMRMSEIIGATYSDICGDYLHIRRAVVTDINGKAVEKDPKTFKGDRYVEIPPRIKSLIGNSGAADERLVKLSNQAIYKRFSRLCEKNHIQHLRFHDLRHANAAVMVRLGFDSKYAQTRNGWSSDAMYKQVYAYVMRDEAKRFDSEIDSFFDGLYQKI